MYDFRTKTALIIDDMPEARSSLRISLSNLGFKSAPQVGTVREALEKLNEIKPDIIMCDYYLGDDIDGQQFLEYLRINNLIPPSVAFVMVTAESSYARVASAAEFTPDVYLLKPFTAEALGQRLSTVMEQREMLAPVLKRMHEEKFHEAISVIDVLLVNPTPFKVALLKLKGECLGQSNLPEAITFYQPLAEKNVPWAIVGLAKALIGSGETDTAMALLEALVATKVPYIEAYDLLASISTPAQALELHQRSTELVPSANRFRKVAQVALKVGEYGVAETSFRSAISKSRHGLNKPVSDNAGYVKALVGAGKVDEAAREMQSLKQTLEKKAVDQADLVHLATAEAGVHLARGDASQAEACLKQAIEASAALKPEQAIELAGLVKQAGFEEEASRLLTAVIANNEGDQQVKHALQHSQFGADYESLVNKSNDEIVAINNQAVGLANAGKLDEAFGMLEAVAQIYHSNATVLFNVAKIGLALIRSGHDDEALRQKALGYLEMGLRVNPQHKAAQESVSAFRQSGMLN